MVSVIHVIAVIQVGSFEKTRLPAVLQARKDRKAVYSFYILPWIIRNYLRFTVKYVLLIKNFDKRLDYCEDATMDLLASK